MFTIGLVSGILTAFFFSFSYLGSAFFLTRYNSPIRLLIFAQVLLGLFSLPFLCFFFPASLTGEKLGVFLGWVGLWILLFVVSQLSFFMLMRKMESSRVSSLLGLKIIVLSIIYIFLKGQLLSAGQTCAVLLSTIAAVGINWSGGTKITPSGIFWLASTLIFYSLTDLVNTRLVRMPTEGNIIANALGICSACYVILGIAAGGLLFKYRPTVRQFKTVLPFAVLWFLSQATLFLCFGAIGAVFGNVIQSARGVISVFLGMALGHWKMSGLDVQLTPKMWRKRIVAALMMTGAIILYSVASR